MLAPLAAGDRSAGHPDRRPAHGIPGAGVEAAAPAEAAHLSIVVLPFTNLSGDPAQDYFADGITENLTTDLSRIRNSFVIARNTAFTFKGKSIDAKEIGKELGVRYVLEGSVQRDQNRVRVNAQLIDAESGAHLWADRFEEDDRRPVQAAGSGRGAIGQRIGFRTRQGGSRKGRPLQKPRRHRSYYARLGARPTRGNNPPRTRTMRRGLCSNRRSRSTRTTPMRWRARHIAIDRVCLLRQPRNRLRCRK